VGDFARLLILADERLLGRGLASLLEPRYETHLIESFDRAGRLLGSDRDEIALWVGDRVDAETVERLDGLRRSHPGVRLCIVAHSAEPDALRPLLARNGGGVAVLLRRDQLDVGEVLTGLDEVIAGRSSLEARILEQLLARSERDDALAPLNASEEQTLELVAFGLRNCEIARRLWKSEKAIEKQVSHVFSKLGLDHDRQPHLDRRVTAARIFLSCRPSAGLSQPPTSRVAAR
jgi:DNA-binding NarL/FixJ family response regulator